MILAADLPAQPRFSEEFLRGILASKEGLDQYFSVDVCKKPPAEWLDRMKQLQLLDAYRSHCKYDMNEPVESYYCKLLLDGVLLMKTRARKFQ